MFTRDYEIFLTSLVRWSIALLSFYLPT